MKNKTKSIAMINGNVLFFLTKNLETPMEREREKLSPYKTHIELVWQIDVINGCRVV
jgi:hypothetical protein